MFVSESKETASGDVDSFYNFADIQMGIWSAIWNQGLGIKPFLICVLATNFTNDETVNDFFSKWLNTASFTSGSKIVLGYVVGSVGRA